MNSAYKHLLGHHPSTFVVDDDVENDNVVVDEDEVEDDDDEWMDGRTDGWMDDR